MLQPHDQQPVGAEPERRGERGVQAQPAVAVVAVADLERRKQERDRGRGERVARLEPGRPGDDEGIARPAADDALAVVDPDDRRARADLGGGDGDRLERAGVDVAP